ncbi:MAG: hypothetical protein GY821_12510 [Gammaproteobacteria bacterium]|nr:hypothetical protein [Gammaproteobacteria bacterium]
MFFKKKKGKIKQRNRELKECKEFRKVGAGIHYMGIKMIVTGHGTRDWDPSLGVYIRPSVRADYINKKGELKHAVFGYEKLSILREQNKTASISDVISTVIGAPGT